jgi:Flp pilus assembly protein TadG
MQPRSFLRTITSRCGSARARSEDGGALVEFALVVPMLLLLVFGIVDFGRAFQSSITLTNATREGARLGATGADYWTICNRVSATAGVSPVTCTVSNAEGASGTSVVVNAQHTLTFITPIGGLLAKLGGDNVGNTYLLKSSTDMRIE